MASFPFEFSLTSLVREKVPRFFNKIYLLHRQKVKTIPSFFYLKVSGGKNFNPLPFPYSPQIRFSM